MPSSTITNHVTPGITLQAPAYYSPLTITSTGAVYSGPNLSAISAPTAGSSIINLGVVSGTSGSGINLAAGGDVTNGASGSTAALIEGSQNGIQIGFSSPPFAPSGVGTVANYGTVLATGTSGTGIRLLAGGSIVNGASGAAAALIEGSQDGVQMGAFNGI